MEESFGPLGEDPMVKPQIAEKQTPAGSSEMVVTFDGLEWGIVILTMS
jgi:hypothetical protein